MTQPRRGSPHRIGSIAESATLAVDAKAKALKAAGRPSSGSAPASRTSRPPTTSSRRPIAAAATRSGTATPRPAACPSSRRRSRPRRCATPATPSPRARCSSPTAASRRSTTRSPRCSTRATRRCCPAPYWTTYPESIRLAGGVPVEIQTDETTGYRVTIEQLEAALTPRTKLLVFVSPSNPTGAVYSPAEVEAIGRWARRRRASGSSPTRSTSTWSTATPSSPRCRTLVPELADRCVVVNGVAKTYAMTGWRVGWMIGPADVDQGRDQPAVARDLQRRQRLAGGGARRGVRRPHRGGRDADGVRPPPPDHHGRSSTRSTA